MKSEYNSLKALREHPGYQILLALWAIQHQKIVDAMRRAGKQNKEMNWRYFAGQQEGFEVALTQVERAMKDMEKEDENLEASYDATKQVDDLLERIKGDKE